MFILSSDKRKNKIGKRLARKQLFACSLNDILSKAFNSLLLCLDEEHMQKEDTITFRTETSLLAIRKLKRHYLPFIETNVNQQ